ncbi:hypothetical protein JHK86_010309 [Glycine max]|nr:hypothetical protein JHK86_010309 [Glycine max]
MPKEHPDECCKEIQSVKLEESSRDDLEYADPSVSDNGVLALTLYGEENVVSQEQCIGLRPVVLKNASLEDQMDCRESSFH